MDTLLTQETISLVIVVIVNCILFYLVFNKNRASATNKIFLALIVVTTFWVITMFISSSPKVSKEILINLVFVRLTIFFAVPQILLFFLLAYTLPDKKFLMNKKLFFLLVFFVSILMVLSLTDIFFKDISINSSSEIVAVVGNGMIIFLIYSVFFSLLAIYLLIKKYIKASGIVKRQIAFMMVGVLVLLCLLIFTVLVPVVIWKESFFINYAHIYVMFFLVMVGISILKYHLFNIKLIATESFVGILIVVLIIEGLLSGSLVELLFKIFFSFLVAVLGVFLVRSVKKEVKQRKEVTRLARKLKKANQKLKELDEIKTEFLSIASHQLRTPLSIIKGYIELIKDNAYGKTTDKTKKILGDIDTSNERLVKLIDEFLDVTRIEQGRTKFVFDYHDINDIISDVVSQLKQRAKEKGIKVSWKPSKTIGKKLYLDPGKIRHVIFNFLDNAIKYSHKGTVRVDIKKEKKGVAVSVRDEGIGFGRKDGDNLFQKFYRGDNVKKAQAGGTGLGLFICKKFVEAHKGRVWAKSLGKGKGSEFGFYIPNQQSK
ncbi:MAG: hypothetical protein GF349_00450 [Candidatus Magasanikbacteria bacterium]|nr:hypothetical protein [Candidatus Magasanikbacteria bacterium]